MLVLAAIFFLASAPISQEEFDSFTRHIDNWEKEMCDAVDAVLKQTEIVLKAVQEEKKKCSKKVNSEENIIKMATAASRLDGVINHAIVVKNSVREYAKRKREIVPDLSDEKQQEFTETFIAKIKKIMEKKKTTHFETMAEFQKEVEEAQRDLDEVIALPYEKSNKA